MNAREFLKVAAPLAVAFIAAACATPKPFDYTNFRQSRPRSILVLPPLNQSTDVRGTYGYLSTVTRPLAEAGYYVFPVAIVDQFLKENGLPGPGEMHQAPLNKLSEIFGADAVLYVTLLEYGTKYHVINSVTTVHAAAKLVDAKTGLLLWEGNGLAQQASGDGGGGLLGMVIAAAVHQIVNSGADSAHEIAGQANAALFTRPAILPGPYNPNQEGVQ